MRTTLYRLWRTPCGGLSVATLSPLSLLRGLATLLLALAVVAPSARAQTSPAIRGEVDGLWYWQLPATANGLRPTMSWSGAGSVPNGDIYVGGMDHRTNSALYRLHANVLSYVGDAKAASSAVGNWLPGETAEKFHTHPTWVNGKMYVATLPSSVLDDSYLLKRGFHWYRFDPVKSTFVDWSAGIGNGTAIAHGGPVGIVAAATRKVMYGAINPTGDIVRLNLNNRVTTVLGHPDYGRAYVYPGRWMWVDANGRLYFTAGNSGVPSYGGEYDPETFNHVRYYDPATGFGERPDWSLHDQRAIDAGQCFPTAGVCFCIDNVGHIYRFTEAGPTWTYLGSIGQETNQTYGFVWVFHVRADRTVAYVISTYGDFFEFNLATGAATRIANIKALAPRLQPMKWLYGHDAWDKQGRFYFSAFSQQQVTGPNVLLTAINPDRLKAAVALGKPGMPRPLAAE